MTAINASLMRITLRVSRFCSLKMSMTLRTACELEEGVSLVKLSSPDCTDTVPYCDTCRHDHHGSNNYGRSRVQFGIRNV